MALNTHALRFIANRKMWVSLGSKAREKCSIRGIDQFTFDAHVKVGAGATNLNQRAYVETHASRDKIRFACTPTRDNGRSVLIFELARTSTSSPTSYRYELPNGWDDRWHHVAFSISTGDGKYAIYFDDIKVKEGRLVGGGFDIYNRALLIDEKVPAEISIGASPSGLSGYNYWDGKIDNVRLFRNFNNGNTYGSEDRPVDDHSNKVGAFAPDINLIEEWRFNEGPFGSAVATTYGVVDHQYDPKLKFDEYQEADNPSQNEGNNTEEDFDPGPPEIAEAVLYEDGVKSNNLWTGVDVSTDILSTAGVVILPKDSDRPFLGEGRADTVTPSIPTDLSTTAITEDSFEVSWRQAFDNIFVQDYQVDVSTFDNFSSLVYTKRTSQRTTERVVGLIPGQRYYWRVRSIDATGNESAWASSTAYIPFKLRSTSRINYSVNPSFEGLRDLTGWQSFAVSGTPPDLSVKDYGTTEVRPENNSMVYGDSYMVVQSNAGVAGIYRGAAHTINWTSGKQMKVSFWVRGDAEFGVYFYMLQNTRVVDTSSLISIKNETTNQSATVNPLGSSWTKYSFTVTPSATGMNKVQLLFVNLTSAEFSFDFEGLLIESENANGIYFDGSRKGTLPLTSYWAVFNTISTATTDGYIVGPSGDSTLSTTDESASVYDVQQYPLELLQTLDFVDRTAPNPPTTATVTHTAVADIGSDSFIAKWIGPSQNFEDIVAYDLQIGLRSNLSAKDAVFVPGYTPARIYDAVLVYDSSLNANVYTKVISGLAPSTTYYYRVRAVDSNGNLSDWSEAKLILTEQFIDNLAPSEVILDEPTDINFEKFTANWREAVDDVGVVGYKLTVARDAALTQVVSGFNLLDVGNTLHFDVYGLQEQTQYYYGVKAYDAAGNNSPLQDAQETMPVQTLVRPEEYGGLVSQRLELESLVNICPTNPTFAFGESDIVNLNCSTEALLQFSLNRTVPRGENRAGILNLARLATNNPKSFYEVTPLAQAGTAQDPFYTPATVTYNTRPSDNGSTKSIYIDQPAPSTGYSVISLDLTDSIQSGGIYYGFRLKIRHEMAELSENSYVFATGAVLSQNTAPRAELLSVTGIAAYNSPASAFFMQLAGTENTDEVKRPELSFAVDTSKDVNITAADARVQSRTTIVRNLFPNPSFDMTASEFPLPNASFDLNDTRYWEVLSSSMTSQLDRSNLSYDSIGGSAQLTVSANNSSDGQLGSVVLSQYRVPAIKGKTYTARAFLATTNPNLKPRVAIYRYAQDGSLLDGSQAIDLAAWSPTANIWYQRTVEYQVSSNDQAAWLQVAIVAQSLGLDATGNGPTGTIRIDAVSISSNAEDTPLYVEELSKASALQVVTQSFDAGYETSGAALQIKTKPISTQAAETGAGARLLASIPSSEGWLTSKLSDATVNLVENPSFETSSISHVVASVVGTVFSSEAVNDAHGTKALEVNHLTTTGGIVISSAELPSYNSSLADKAFVGSCWVQGGYTYSVRLSLVYADNSKVDGTVRSFTVPAGQWQRLTAVGSDPIFVTGGVYKTGSQLKKIEMKIEVTVGSVPAGGVTWYVDGVQIEEKLNSSYLPSSYCDGNLDDCVWYGLPNQSISFRGAFVSSFKLYTAFTEASATNLLAKMRLTSTSGSVFESPILTVGSLPANGGWASFRTWPVVALGATPEFPPVEASLDLFADSAVDKTYIVDGVVVTFNDAAKTYFNGSTLKGSWRLVPFSSLSEYQGVQIDARVFTLGNLYDRGSIRSWIRDQNYQNMGFVEDESFITRYERDSRYTDVRFPDRIRWNEVYNPSFELNATNWSTQTSTISNKLTSTANSGSAVGVWTLVGASPSTAELRTTNLVPVEKDQLWTARGYVRTPLITRATPVKFKFGVIFYNSSGAAIDNAEHTREITITDRTGWTLVDHSVVAPSEARWVRVIFKNVAVSPSFGLQTNEQLELDSMMLYNGRGSRYYFDGDNSLAVRWEGRRHASPSVFTINGGQFYTTLFSADDGEGTLVGDAVEVTTETVLESTDFMQFLFDEHRRNVTSRSIELVIPYIGENEDEVSLTGVYRRIDSFERFPLLIEVNKFRNEVYVRADDLAQNREYVIEIDVVATDFSKLRGERNYETRLSSSIRDSLSNDSAGDGSVKFAGFPLNGPESTYYWVSEHDAFSLPDRRTQIETIPRMDGGVELKPYWGTKKISLSGGVWGNSRTELYDNVNALRAALVEQRGKLQIDTLAKNEDFYYATCTDFTTKEVAGEALNSLEWSASFECADPFLYRGEPRVSTFEIVSSKPNNSVETFYTEDQKFTVLNSGTVNSNPKITLAVTRGSGDYAISFVNETTGQRLMPKAVLNRNDAITADTTSQAVFKNQSLPLDYVGSFIELKPGPNIIRASVKDLKESRHNLLLNPGVERGPASFTNSDDDGIRPNYNIDNNNNKIAVAGVTVTRNRFQTTTGSDYSALVACDGLQARQGVIFSSKKDLSKDRFSAKPTERRTFSASAYVRADSANNRTVVLNNCFIRIWYMDGTSEDQELTLNAQYTLNTQWKLIQLPKLTSQSKAINYVEVLILFKSAVGSQVSFYVDNVLLTQEDLAIDQVEAAFQLTVLHQERFI